MRSAQIPALQPEVTGLQGCCFARDFPYRSIDMSATTSDEHRSAGAKRAFSGIQPSGVVHIGNYVGAIRKWVAMMAEYECTFCVVDLHAMTVPYQPEDMRRRIFETYIMNMAAGLDPERACLFVQSHVPEVAELCWILMNCAAMGDLSRMTQFKDKSERAGGRVNAGLFTYPVLMAADILLYKASAVPVGDDQVQHLEFAREVCRRFNSQFGETFPEPMPLHSEVTRLMGLDGKDKMSKSLDNCIYLDDPDDVIEKKLSTAKTDPARQRRTDPGNPDVCNIFSYHKIFSTEEEQTQCAEGCRTAGIGCLDCKKILIGHVKEMIGPVRDRREELLARPADILDVLRSGADRARPIAEKTMDEVRAKLGVVYGD